MSKGPQLTQRKLDKLQDALNVVMECEQVQWTDPRWYDALENAKRTVAKLQSVYMPSGGNHD